MLCNFPGYIVNQEYMFNAVHVIREIPNFSGYWHHFFGETDKDLKFEICTTVKKRISSIFLKGFCMVISKLWWMCMCQTLSKP